MITSCWSGKTVDDKGRRHWSHHDMTPLMRPKFVPWP
jgi:hypothetical protein